MLLDEKTSPAIYQKAIWQAKKLGFYAHAEDIAGEVMIHFLEGNGKNQTVKQAVIDVIRKIYGRIQSKHNQGKKALLNPYSILPKDIGTTRLRQENGNDFHLIMEMLTGTDRIIFCLFYHWGFTEQEIGYILKLSASRVHQLRKIAFETLLNRIR